MRLNEYQEKAMSTCMDTCYNFSYMFLNLVGEVGEFASKVAKEIRKDNVCIGYDESRSNEYYCYDYNGNYDRIDKELKLEVGDILWQLAGLCEVKGWKLEDIAQMNLDKLASRKKRNVIDGDGDNR